MKKRSLVLFSVLLIVLVLLSSCAGVGPRTGASDIASQPSTSSVAQVVSTTSGTPAGTSSEVAKTPAQGSDLTTQIFQFAPIILVFVAFYFFLIRPQKKKEKETVNMRNSIQIGDEVTTAGGIIGKVVAIKDEDQFIIETGADKTKIRIARWAIQQKNTISG